VGVTKRSAAMTLPKSFCLLDDNDPTNLPMNPQDPILQEGHYCSCGKYCIMDVRHHIVSIQQCFQWFKEKYLHKRPVCSSDCVHYVEDIRTPSIAPNSTSAITTISQEHIQCNTLRTVNHSDAPGNTSSSTSSISTNDHHSMDFDGNKDSYTRTTQVIATGGRTKNRTLSQYSVKVQPNNQFVPSDGTKSIITDAATVTTNQNRILTRSKHPMSPLPPLSPSRQSITIKKNRKTSERTDYSDVASTTTSDSMSTVTMDPAIRVVSSLSSDSLMLLQSNDPSTMISPSPFQRQQRHEKVSSLSTADVESPYHAIGKYHHHTIYTMDDSIWRTGEKGDNGDFDYEKTAPTSLEEHISIPQSNRNLSPITIQNKVPWKNRYPSDYNSEPILSKVAPLPLLEI
jgi:hypothetical protein